MLRCNVNKFLQDIAEDSQMKDGRTSPIPKFCLLQMGTITEGCEIFILTDENLSVMTKNVKHDFIFIMLFSNRRTR